MTFQQIKDKLFDIADRRSSGFQLHDTLDKYFSPLACKNPIQYGWDEIGPVRLVDQSEYDEDRESTKIFTVYHFIDHDVYIKFTGWSTSYDDNTFDTIKEVRPITKTITVYE